MKMTERPQVSQNLSRIQLLKIKIYKSNKAETPYAINKIIDEMSSESFKENKLPEDVKAKANKASILIKTVQPARR